MVFVNWMYADNKAEYAAAAMHDAQNIAQQLPTLIANCGLPTTTITRYALHEGKLNNQLNSLAAQWRTLFAQAVIKLEHENDNEYKREDLA